MEQADETNNEKLTGKVCEYHISEYIIFTLGYVFLVILRIYSSNLNLIFHVTIIMFVLNYFN